MTVTTILDFIPEKVAERKAKEAEDERIMDLLGRFTAEMLKDALRNECHPKSEWGEDVSWRYYYINECSRRGKKLLLDLGWPTNDDAEYVNIHTGGVETLINIATANGYFADRHTIANQSWSIVEHWEPYQTTS